MLSKKLIKYIQSLSHKKLRDEEGVFIAEGPKIVAELLAGNRFLCRMICARESWILSNEKLLNHVDTGIHEINEYTLNKISLLKTPNLVIGIFEKARPKNTPDFENKLTIILDDISDPGNLGTIIRIADWFGIENIFCSEHCVDVFNPKVIQSTMGSIGRVNVWYADLASIIVANKNIPPYAATLDGTSIAEFENTSEGFILIGNEANGISDKLLALVKHHITIPRLGEAESLNAAVATGIILSHMTSNITPGFY